MKRFPYEYNGNTFPSRQTLRAFLRSTARLEMDTVYGGESHHVRRAMAQARGNRDYRELFGLELAR